MRDQKRKGDPVMSFRNPIPLIVLGLLFVLAAGFLGFEAREYLYAKNCMGGQRVTNAFGITVGCVK